MHVQDDTKVQFFSEGRILVDVNAVRTLFFFFGHEQNLLILLLAYHSTIAEYVCGEESRLRTTTTLIGFS